MAFIIDTYNKYNSWDRNHAKHIFEVNGIIYAIKEVQLEWGQPILPLDITLEHQHSYYVYGTIDEALQFVNIIKSIN